MSASNIALPMRRAKVARGKSKSRAINVFLAAGGRERMCGWSETACISQALGIFDMAVNCDKMHLGEVRYPWS